MRLDGKVAIVSGGAGGIGSATVRRFVQESASVVIADVQADEAEALTQLLRKQGYSVTFMPLDVTDENQWEQVMKATIQTYGRVDILVNNAGILLLESLVDTSLEMWNRLMDVNSTGAFLGTREAVRVMRANGGGSIINMSSTAGIVGSAMASAYDASKASVRLLTKAAAVAYAKDGIRINSIHPGFIESPMTSGLDEATRRAFVNLHPIGRAGRPEEIANACLFLASDESSFVTGAELVVDGGFTAQ